MAIHQALTARLLHTRGVQRLPSLGFANFEAARASRLGDIEGRRAKMRTHNPIRPGGSLP